MKVVAIVIAVFGVMSAHASNFLCRRTVGNQSQYVVLGSMLVLCQAPNSEEIGQSYRKYCSAALLLRTKQAASQQGLSGHLEARTESSSPISMSKLPSGLRLTFDYDLKHERVIGRLQLKLSDADLKSRNVPFSPSGTYTCLVSTDGQ